MTYVRAVPGNEPEMMASSAQDITLDLGGPGMTVVFL